MLADAIERGRAYLDAGASTVFVPGLLDEPTVAALVAALGERKLLAGWALPEGTRRLN